MRRFHYPFYIQICFCFPFRWFCLVWRQNLCFLQHFNKQAIFFCGSYICPVISCFAAAKTIATVQNQITIVSSYLFVINLKNSKFTQSMSLRIPVGPYCYQTGTASATILLQVRF